MTLTLTIDEQDMPALLIGLAAYKGFLRQAIESGARDVTVGGITLGSLQPAHAEAEIARIRRHLIAQRDQQIAERDLAGAEG